VEYSREEWRGVERGEVEKRNFVVK